MRHGPKKEREKRRRMGATIVKKKDEMRGAPVDKGAPTDGKGVRAPILQPMVRCSNGRPGSTCGKKGGNRMERAGQS
jgi:hypothetical protein